MGLIAIEDVRFFAHHGVYEEERLVGNEFVVDVYVGVKMDSNTSMDEISETLNYETIFHCCKKIMRQPKDLLETLCIDIVKQLKQQFSQLESLKVRVRKFNPMPGERVGSSLVEIEEDYTAKCSSCGKKFSCYKSGSCWCFDESISESGRIAMKEKFKGCLCPDCIQQFRK